MHFYTVLILGASAVVGALNASAPLTAAAPRQPAQTAVAVFAGGCFWCMEPPFDKMDGVTSTISGYSGGRVKNPTYEQVSSGGTGHTEVVQITYDPSKVTYARLLETFWRNIDPLDAGGQFCDRGGQYRSAIFYGSESEKRLAEASKQKVQEQLKDAVATEIVAAAEFYPAEDYHQDYYTRNALKYKFYRWNCGRDQRLDKLWGKPSDG